jgi:large subunit ribosomal protein L2
MASTLRKILKKNSGRDNSGSVVVRHQGGRQKRYYRIIDFKRNKLDMVGTVIGMEYDPNRSVDLLLVQYSDGEKRYILKPLNVELGDKVVAGETADIKNGNAMLIKNIPIGTPIHNVELTKGKGGQIVRSAGNQALIVAKEDKYVQIKLPSGETRRILNENYATIGQLSKVEWKDRVLRKAGTKRHMGIRPTVRGVAQDPKSHPHGGGEGRSGIGLKSPKTFAGRKAVGKTRDKKKYSNSMILKKENKR